MDTGTPPRAPSDRVAGLRLLQLVSPALPIGAFAYSRGLESAVELGWVRDAESARAWIGGVLDRTIARLDAPIVLRLHRSIGGADHEATARWIALADASRESGEMQAESRALGVTFARLLGELGVASAEELAPPIGTSHLACFALACVRWDIEEDDAVRACLWSALEGQVTAALKLVPLGQTDGQRILFAEAARIGALASGAADLADEDLGALAPGLAIASALHETQHTRLFRS
ncbi:MAG: urease accessory protein UreF [Myxococcota bacterium]|nr:urease accessory protein UreF [Myxococcota bacterium]